MPSPVRLGGVALGVALAGCGGANASSTARTTAPAPIVARTTDPSQPCTQTVASTLGQIAARIYHQAAAGGNVLGARSRLAHSSALADAVARGSASAANAALAPLLKQQIHRIVITHAGRTLVSYGTTRSLAPVHGTIRRGGIVVGRYTMSVGTDVAIAGITHAITGSQVVMRSAGHDVISTLTSGTVGAPRGGKVTVGGVTYNASMLRGTAFPSGALQIWLLTPPAACATAGADAIVQTIGTVGERLFRAEATGSAVQRTLRHVALDRGFQSAVANDDAAALRTAIIRMFRTHSLHVVRIRATDASGRLVNDVGGPYALAPASRSIVTAGGRRLGRVTLSIQDDTGYIKLMHRFTGAQVLLRTPARQIPGSSLSPGPATIPDTGTVRYRGRAYRAYSFAAKAFPDGPLRISLLIPESSSA